MEGSIGKWTIGSSGVIKTALAIALSNAKRICGEYLWMETKIYYNNTPQFRSYYFITGGWHKGVQQKPLSSPDSRNNNWRFYFLNSNND